jgi:hypothetical protein
MKTNHLLLWGFLTVYTPTMAWTSESTTTATPSAPPARFAHAAVPEGNTLPARVLRVRAVDKFVFGGDYYDADGKREDIGLRTNVQVNAFVAEYGITDRLSFRMLVPTMVHNEATMNLSQFARSDKYQTEYNKALDKVVEKGYAQFKKMSSPTATKDDFRRYIKSHGTIPTGFPLDTGEVLPSDRSIQTHMHNTVMRGATPTNGHLGLGDMETGLLYNFYRTDSMLVSTGLGLRAPTGDFSDNSIRRTVGGGIYDGGLRFNFDYSPAFGLWLSAQVQYEHALTSTKQKRASRVNPYMLNESTPLDGDNTQKYEKRGVDGKELLKANYGFGAWTPALKAFAVNTYYQYHSRRATYLDGEVSQASGSMHGVGGGGSVSGLAYALPVAFDVDYFSPVAGTNAIANNELTMTLHLYAKF